MSDNEKKRKGKAIICKFSYETIALTPLTPFNSFDS